MIPQINCNNISRFLSIKTGIKFLGASGVEEGDDFIIYHIEDPPSPNGFSVRVGLFWKRIELLFVPDKFSRRLIESMGRTPDGLITFRALARLIGERNGGVEMRVNGIPVDPESLVISDTPWTKFFLKVVVFADESIDLSDIRSSEAFLKEWTVLFTKTLFALLPVEEVEEYEEPLGCFEGASYHAMVKKYERSRLNRWACIEFHDSLCKVCGCDFSERYGQIGEGFIHIHHIVPVSDLGGEYRLDPRTDLIPVCPNCHAMLHMTDPPLSVEELRQRYREHISEK